MLKTWLNKNMKIKLSDNRIIVGIFLCTDCHQNIILGSSYEYLNGKLIEIINFFIFNIIDFRYR